MPFFVYLNIMKVKNIINKILLSAYIILMIAIPLVVLFMAINRNIVPFSDSGWMNGGRLAYIFISIPAYFVYARMMVKDFFPKENIKALYLFVPVFITIGLYFINKPDNLLEMLISDSLPLYLGLNLLFFLGLFKLIFSDEFSIGRLIIGIIIMFLLFFGAVCLFIIGLQLSTKYEVNSNDSFWLISKYIFTILLVSFFHFNLFVKMGNEGKF